MYINIKKAEKSGLHININEDKNGKKFLVIDSQNSLNLESLQALEGEMLERLNLERGEVGSILDKVSMIIHHATIWSALKNLDDSER